MKNVIHYNIPRGIGIDSRVFNGYAKCVYCHSTLVDGTRADFLKHDICWYTDAAPPYHSRGIVYGRFVFPLYQDNKRPLDWSTFEHFQKKFNLSLPCLLTLSIYNLADLQVWRLNARECTILWKSKLLKPKLVREINRIRLIDAEWMLTRYVPDPPELLVPP